MSISMGRSALRRENAWCSGAHGLTQKLYNWDTLNQKVFRKLGFLVSKAEIEAAANCEAGAVERILKLLRTKLEDKSPFHQRSVVVLMDCPMPHSARCKDLVLQEHCAGALGQPDQSQIPLYMLIPFESSSSYLKPLKFSSGCRQVFERENLEN